MAVAITHADRPDATATTRPCNTASETAMIVIANDIVESEVLPILMYDAAATAGEMRRPPIGTARQITSAAQAKGRNRGYSRPPLPNPTKAPQPTAIDR